MWDWKFGSLLWATHTPSFWRAAKIDWDMQFDQDRKSLEPFRGVRPEKPSCRKNPSKSSKPEDEHAIWYESLIHCSIRPRIFVPGKALGETW